MDGDTLHQTADHELETLLVKLRERLLDLTPRNRILNFAHPAKHSLRIIGVPLEATFATLNEDRFLDFQPVPTPEPEDLAEFWRWMGEPERKDKPRAEDYARYLGWRTEYVLPSEEDERRRPFALRSRHYAGEQEALLRRIRNEARQIERDTGAHLLFLAFGFLAWREKPGQQADRGREFLAPLLFVPVTLEEARIAGGRGWRLRLVQAEPMVNPVLARKLEVDYRRALPAFREDADLGGWLRSVKDAVAGGEGLAVRRFLTLGLFHFGGYALWADLDPARWSDGGPAAAPLVRQVFGAEPFPTASGGTPMEGEPLARLVDLDLPLVLPADLSQGRALAMALAGQTMLVEGPPGTGKSQTITNLIAGALEAGKTVLFVSAKRPALDVVVRRLEEVGLGEFCLDLHGESETVSRLLAKVERARKGRQEGCPHRSNKSHPGAGPRDTLAQLGRALLDEFEGEPVSRLLLRAGTLRHTAIAAGIAAFVERLDLDTTGARMRAGHEQLEVAIGPLRALGTEPHRHPWRGVDGTRVLGVDRERLQALLQAWVEAARVMERERQGFETRWGAPPPDPGPTLEIARRWSTHLAAIDRVRATFDEMGRLLGIVVPPRGESVAVGSAVVRCAERALSLALEDRSPGLLDEDYTRVLGVLEHRIAAYREAVGALAGRIDWPVKEPQVPDDLRRMARLLRETGVLGRLGKAWRQAKRTAERLGARGDAAERAAALEQLATVLERQSEIERFEEARRILGAGFRGVDTGIESLRALVHWARTTVAELESLGLGRAGRRLVTLERTQLEALARTAATLEPFEPLRATVGDLVTLLREIVVPAPYRWFCFAEPERVHEIVRAIERLGEVEERASQAWIRFVEACGLDEKLWLADVGNDLAARIARAEQALAAARALDAWLAWSRASRSIECPVATALLQRAGAADLAPEQLPLAYDYLLALNRARAALRAHRELALTTPQQWEQTRERFDELDEQALETRPGRIAATLRTKPEPRGVTGVGTATRTEAALLTALIAQKRPRMRLREVVERAFGALQALLPCFMMGPAAVAQYLPRKSGLFDLLIVDEASQLTEEEAVGALARAKQAVIVGDTKQLPPTSFFKRYAIDEEAEEEVEVSAGTSVMDRAKQQIVPTAMLRWHYRSRHESLIAFSNASFYDNELVVFPSAHGSDPRYGIACHYVEGGAFAGRKNEREADAVVARILDHLAHDRHRSLGVAAMNLEQAELIEERLAHRLEEHRQLAVRLEALRNGVEPFFVKNLENVQGDERDVILISMTYGPERPGGPVPQRFGPLGAEDGWRRLNVLITRAKERMEVFTSMRASDVLGEGGRRGRKALHDFLDFLESGRLAVPPPPPGPGPEPETLFEAEVIGALERAGWLCVPQLRTAGFRLDIAVRDPDEPDRFLLGIECDGATYHASASARERDRLRQQILEGLGWEIHRVWSTAWFEDPERELAAIRRRLDELRARRRLRAASAPALSAPASAFPDAAPLPARPTPRGERGLPADRAMPRAGPAPPELALEEPVVGARTPEDVRAALVRLREEVIEPEMPQVPRERGLLRRTMLEALVRHRPTDEREFRERIPLALRQGTDPEQFRRYADRVFALLAELG